MHYFGSGWVFQVRVWLCKVRVTASSFPDTRARGQGGLVSLPSHSGHCRSPQKAWQVFVPFPPAAHPGARGVVQPVRDLQRVPGLGRPSLWMVCASQHVSTCSDNTWQSPKKALRWAQESCRQPQQGFWDLLGVICLTKRHFLAENERGGW